MADIKRLHPCNDIDQFFAKKATYVYTIPCNDIDKFFTKIATYVHTIPWNDIGMEDFPTKKVKWEDHIGMEGVSD